MVTYPNLYYLQYFVDAVELESVSAAARRNRVSHPAVSRAIKYLEEQHGVQLLDHKKKFFRVTEAGARFAQQARTLLDSANGFTSGEAIRETSAMVKLSIGLSRSLFESDLAAIVIAARKKFDDPRIQIRFGTTSEIVDAVAKKEIDLGLTIGTQDLPTLKQTLVKEGTFLLVESASQKRTASHLNSKAFILTEPRLETEVLRQGYQRQFGEELPVVMEVRSWGAIMVLVQQGLGVGLVPDLTLTKSNRHQFRILKPDWFEFHYGVYLHTRRGSPSNALRDFVATQLRGTSDS